MKKITISVFLLDLFLRLFSFTKLANDSIEYILGLTSIQSTDRKTYSQIVLTPLHNTRVPEITHTHS